MSKPPLDITNQELAVRRGHVELQGKNDVAYDCRSVGWTFAEFLIHRLGDYAGDIVLYKYRFSGLMRFELDDLRLQQ